MTGSGGMSRLPPLSSLPFGVTSLARGDLCLQAKRHSSLIAAQKSVMRSWMLFSLVTVATMRGNATAPFNDVTQLYFTLEVKWCLS